MFIKGYPKYNKTTGESYWIYKLCESYRINGNIRHYIILGLGKLEDIETLEERFMLSGRIEELIRGGGNSLAIGVVSAKVERLAQQYYMEIKAKKRYDVKSKKGEWETVNMSTLNNKDGDEIGVEWMCKQAFDQLGIGEFLKTQGWGEEKIALATTHIISRAVYPASELKTVSYIKENTAVCELTGYDRDKITKDQLYGISHKLYLSKDNWRGICQGELMNCLIWKIR